MMYIILYIPNVILYCIICDRDRENTEILLYSDVSDVCLI